MIKPKVLGDIVTVIGMVLCMCVALICLKIIFDKHLWDPKK